jgi:uncharacterized repeat protein (TIGR01451 family)
MGSNRLRQGPQQHRLAGISLRSTVLGLVLGVALLAAAPGVALGAADLSVSGTASPEPVPAGQELTYTITVHNAGPDPATAATLEFELGQGLSPVSASATGGGTCTAAPIVKCDLGTITSGQANDVTATIVASVGPQAPSALNSAATVYSPDDTNPDPANDYSEVLTHVTPVADLALTMTAVPDPVVAGDLLTYSIVVENRGPSTATGVRVTDTLPAGVDFVAASSACSEATGTVTCDVGTVTGGTSSTLDITVRPLSPGSITNDVTVASPVEDPNPGDNTVSVGATVSPLSGGASADGGGPKTGPLDVLLTGSYVLISGRSVKLVKRRFVPVKLTCAGQRKCEGTITISTAKPIKTAKKHRKGKKGKKRKRRIARLGSKKFAIEGNRQQQVLVPISKSKLKLLRRLKRVKAKAAIREIDVHGHPRLSTRTFTLRAR